MHFHINFSDVMDEKEKVGGALGFVKKKILSKNEGNGSLLMVGSLTRSACFPRTRTSQWHPQRKSFLQLGSETSSDAPSPKVVHPSIGGDCGLPRGKKRCIQMSDNDNKVTSQLKWIPDGVDKL